MLKILVIDDLDINIRVITSILSFRKNVIVNQAVGGREAISQIENNKFDIIITDIFMPEMNGFQLADIINDNYGGIPIIAVSAGDTDVEEECKKHGIKYYLSKPIIPDKLYKIIDEISSSESEIVKSKSDTLPESPLLEKLKGYTSGNINLLKKLLKKFIDILPIRLDEITALLQNDHQSILEEKIHNLKGFSLVYVSEDTGEKIKEFEKFVKNTGFDYAKDKRIEMFDLLKFDIDKDFKEIKNIYEKI